MNAGIRAARSMRSMRSVGPTWDAFQDCSDPFSVRAYLFDLASQTVRSAEIPDSRRREQSPRKPSETPRPTRYNCTPVRSLTLFRRALTLSDSAQCCSLLAADAPTIAPLGHFKSFDLAPEAPGS